MMKKMYKQPIVEQAEMQPHSIICTSTGFGESSENVTPGETIELP